MAKQIIIAEQHQIAAVFSDDQIEELVVAAGNQQVSDIYLGLVENVIPGIDAAFVNIGDAERNGFIHVTDLGPLRLKKSAGAITELLTPQQKVLVQVMKEPTGNKGPRLTGNISLPGRYLVLMPYGKGVNLSRRIKNENERSRLRALAILIKPAGMGLLVRTEADGKAEEAIMEDLETLLSQWEYIQQQGNNSKPPALLNRDDDFIQKVLRDLYTAEVNRIVVDSQAGFKRVRQNLMNWSGGRTPEGVLIDHHQDNQSILDYFRINAAIKEALKPRVDLPSGGYIIIQPTEALTVIDVNSGSFTRSATSRETVLWTNNEAATEIARQLRLRNIGGVIIVDFIDMDSRKDQFKLIEHFTKTLKSDKARPQIAQLSELGLVELTRKRQGKNIYELFGQTCSICGGLGYLAYLPGISDAQCLENQLPPVSTAAVPLVIKPPEKSTPQAPILAETGSEIVDEDNNQSSSVEFINHPDYQETAIGSNNIRRRRRRRPGEEELSINNNNSQINEKEQENNNNTPKTKDRGVSLRAARREDPKVETVNIEMTRLEQEVYALMGISPLVRLEEEFSNPQSIIIQVTEPQDSLPVETNETTYVETDSQPQLEIELTTEDKTEDDSEESLPEEAEFEVTTPEDEIKLDYEENDSEENNFDEGDGDIDESDENRPIIRRRKRRSSATETT